MRQPIKLTFLILFFLFGLNSLALAQEQITITTYYPAPYGSYNELQLYPHSPSVALCDAAHPENTGMMFVDSSDNNTLKVCNGTAWISSSSLWDLSGTNLYPHDLSWNVGIGTNSPQDKLDVFGSITGYKGIRTGSIYLGQYDGGGGAGVSSLGRIQYYTGPTPSFIEFPAGGDKILLMPAINVGIGTGTPDPAAKLDVLQGTTTHGQLGYTETTSQTVCQAPSQKSCNDPIICGSCCGGNWIPPCFSADTKIALKAGSRPIKLLKKGDVVKSFDIEKNQITYSTVKDIYEKQADSYFVINGRIKVTAEHPFYTQRGWQKVKDLNLKNLLFNGVEYIKVKSIRRIDKKIKVYNLTVDKPNNYFAAGVLVHNKEVAYCDDSTNDTSCSGPVGTSSCNYTCCYRFTTQTNTLEAGVRGVATAPSWAGYFSGPVKASDVSVSNSLSTETLGVSNSATVGSLGASFISTVGINIGDGKIEMTPTNVWRSPTYGWNDPDPANDQTYDLGAHSFCAIGLYLHDGINGGLCDVWYDGVTDTWKLRVAKWFTSSIQCKANCFGD